MLDDAQVNLRSPLNLLVVGSIPTRPINSLDATGLCLQWRLAVKTRDGSNAAPPVAPNWESETGLYQLTVMNTLPSAMTWA
jgi:hypothetical protein